MIQIEKHQLEQIEYLLDQSAQGIHFLFDSPSIRKILKNPTENLDFFTLENRNRIQALLSQFLEKKTFSDKARYLEKLDPETYELLLRSYFNIVDNSVFQATKLKH